MDEKSGELVGFGTIEICDDYRYLADDRSHPYIPLLAVHPNKQGQGFGNAIIRHLIAEAANLVHPRGGPRYSDTLFLDVYVSNTAAISLYVKNGFVQVSKTPLHDSNEGQDYFVMAKRVSVANI